MAARQAKACITSLPTEILQQILLECLHDHVHPFANLVKMPPASLPRRPPDYQQQQRNDKGDDSCAVNDNSRCEDRRTDEKNLLILLGTMGETNVNLPRAEPMREERFELDHGEESKNGREPWETAY